MHAFESNSGGGGGGGVNHFKGSQSEQQNLVGSGTQTQYGPMDCCATQYGSPQSTVNIDQSSFQSASQGEAADQTLFIDGQFFTPGFGTITHHARNNADSISESVSGTGFQALSTACFNGVEGGCFSSPGGGSE